MRYRERDEAARAAFAGRIKGIPAEKVIYVDESSIEHRCCREYGWSARGEEIHGETSGKTHGRTSMISGLRGKRCVAPFAFGGNTDGATFALWVERRLVPEISPGDHVVLDNVAFHKSARVRELVEGVGGTLLFLPPYSPDLNPIEQYWAFVKGKMRMNRHRFKRFFNALKYVFNLKYCVN